MFSFSRPALAAFAALALLFAGLMMLTPALADIVHAETAPQATGTNANCTVSGWQGQGGDCRDAGTTKVAAQATAQPAQAQPAAAPSQDEADQSDHWTIYFGFNSSTLSADTRKQLDATARDIRAHDRHARHLIVLGYTDRLGSVAYNKMLAMKRARAVRAYLVHRGVASGSIAVRALGKSAAHADCASDLVRAALIDCLREDRRVDIRFAPAHRDTVVHHRHHR